MRLPTSRQPIIILGMHRSGTSMVSELLDQLGLFVGAELQDDHESTYFLAMNNGLMERVSATWDYPAPFVEFLKMDEAVNMSITALTADLSATSAHDFFGGSRWRGRASFQTFDKPWGWKDPRTVITLPIWLRIFPDAKIVYIVRNGVDVARSLLVREKKLFANRLRRFEKRMARRSRRTHLDRAGFKGSMRCLSLMGGFTLWEEYLQRAEENLSGIANSVHRLRYEDMLADPQTHLAELVKFCELDSGSEAITGVTSQINSSRALAFMSDPEAAALYEQVKRTPWMKRFGYDSLPCK